MSGNGCRDDQASGGGANENQNKLDISQEFEEIAYRCCTRLEWPEPFVTAPILNALNWTLEDEMRKMRRRNTSDKKPGHNGIGNKTTMMI